MKHFDAQLDLDLIKDRYDKAFAIGGEIQMFIDSTVIKGIEKYVPMDKGDLTKSAIMNTKIGSGEIKWVAPYAQYVWHGMSATGEDLVYQTSNHPLAGRLWAERYKADHGKELREQVIRRIESL